MAAFEAEMEANYNLALEADEVDLFSSHIVVPIPPMACPLETLEYYADAVMFVAEYENL